LIELDSIAASIVVVGAAGAYENASPTIPATAGVAAEVPQNEPYQPFRPVV